MSRAQVHKADFFDPFHRFCQAFFLWYTPSCGCILAGCAEPVAWGRDNPGLLQEMSGERRRGSPGTVTQINAAGGGSTSAPSCFRSGYQGIAALLQILRSSSVTESPGRAR